MIAYFRYEKGRLERKRIAEMSKGVGKPKVGGPFVLKDLEGKLFTDEDLRGRYSFVCFLFFFFVGREMMCKRDWILKKRTSSLYG
jgi:protein SCO1